MNYYSNCYLTILGIEIGHLNVKQLQLYERIQLCYLFDLVVGHLTYAKVQGKGFSGVPQNFGSLFMGVIIWGPPQAPSPALRGSALRRKSQKGRGKNVFCQALFPEQTGVKQFRTVFNLFYSFIYFLLWLVKSRHGNERIVLRDDSCQKLFPGRLLEIIKRYCILCSLNLSGNFYSGTVKIFLLHSMVLDCIYFYFSVLGTERLIEDIKTFFFYYWFL